MEQLNLNLLLGREENEQEIIDCLNHFEEKIKLFKILISVKGEIGTKTPMTFAILFAPKLYAPKAPANKRAALVYASKRRMCNLLF